MSLPSYIDRATALPDANSIKIQRLDGGWLVVTSNLEIPLACRSVAEVLDLVRQFLGDGVTVPSLEEADDGRQAPKCGAVCMLSKIDGGYLVTNITSPQHNTQFIRFTSRDIVLAVANWAGFVEAGRQRTHFPRPPTPPSSIDGDAIQ